MGLSAERCWLLMVTWERVLSAMKKLLHGDQSDTCVRGGKEMNRRILREYKPRRCGYPCRQEASSNGDQRRGVAARAFPFFSLPVCFLLHFPVVVSVAVCVTFSAGF